ncbi:MAG: hypothetical protein ACOX6U_09480 [Oscillospiraceae bacterium]|jgi:hypothetical protein
MKTVRCKAFLLTTLLLSLALLFALPVSADMGPKPQLTVHVINPPEEPYYLDLLIQEPGGYSNLSEEKRASLNPEMLALLDTYREEGWYPAYVGGTKVPMWGDLTGTPEEGGRVHVFGYYGLSTNCRIILVTQSGRVVVSQEVARQALQSSVTFDYQAAANGGEAVLPLTEESDGVPVHTPNPFLLYLVQFLSTCVPTLLLEGAILLLFRFRLRENWKVFLSTNLATQVLLTLTLGITLIQGGSIAAYMVQLPVELVILVAEVLVYGKCLKGHSATRARVYGAVANLVSWAAGFFLLEIQYRFLTDYIA